MSLRRAAFLLLALTGCSLLGPSDEVLSGGECRAGTRRCGRDCVPLDNPSTGCGGPSCAPCALAHASTRCFQGRCAIEHCEPGWSDCDLDPSNGCETPRGVRRTCSCHGVRLTSSARFSGPATGLAFGSGDWTIELWLKQDDGLEGILLSLGDSPVEAERTGGVVLSRIGGRLRGFFNRESPAVDGNESVTAEAPVGLHQWSHVTLQRRGEVLTLFINGALAGEAFSVEPVRGGGRLTLGRPINSTVPTFTGTVGPMRLSSVARYEAPFTPAVRWSRDDATMALYLVDLPITTEQIIDEAGGDNTLGPGAGGVAEEDDLPCP